MPTKTSDIYRINSPSAGIAWVDCLNLVEKNGSLIHDNQKELKEILNVFVSVDNPLLFDEILESYSDPLMIKWMEDNFLKTQPILDWGYSYGQRLFEYNDINQIEAVIEKLQKNPESKSATLTLMNPENDQKHIPCIVSLDFKIRDGKLITTAFFRSQDVGKKMYADIISLGKISQLVAEKLTIETGSLNIFIVSLHLYLQDMDKIKFLIK